VTRSYDPRRRILTLSLRQSLAPTPGQPGKELLHIPIAIGLIGPDGEELPLRYADEALRPAGSRVIVVSVLTPVLTPPVVAGENAVPLSGLSVPILFVHHQDDQCALSPHAGVQALVNQLTAPGKDATLVTITGGPADANECDSGLGHHSFQGMEPQVVTAITSWINSKLP